MWLPVIILLRDFTTTLMEVESYVQVGNNDSAGAKLCAMNLIICTELDFTVCRSSERPLYLLFGSCE